MNMENAGTWYIHKLDDLSMLMNKYNFSIHSVRYDIDKEAWAISLNKPASSKPLKDQSYHQKRGSDALERIDKNIDKLCRYFIGQRTS